MATAATIGQKRNSEQVFFETRNAEDYEVEGLRVGKTEFKLDTHPGRTLHLLLFANVQNSKELLHLLQAGVLQPELAFINASLVPDTFPVLAAAHKVLVSEGRGRLVTRNLHSELIFNYSSSKHISESLLRCGITDSTSYLLVARFDATAQDLQSVRQLVQGTEVDLVELSKRADIAQIQKHFKLSSVELEISSQADAITCRIAARDAL